MVEERGPVTILKNNKPHLVVMPYSETEKEEFLSDEVVSVMVRQFADKYSEALEELAK